MKLVVMAKAMTPSTVGWNHGGMCEPDAPIHAYTPGQLHELAYAGDAKIDLLYNALKELVECKDLADRFDELKQDVHDFATAAVLEGVQAEYQRRKPAAWAAARAALEAVKTEVNTVNT